MRLTCQNNGVDAGALEKTEDPDTALDIALDMGSTLSRCHSGAAELHHPRQAHPALGVFKILRHAAARCVCFCVAGAGGETPGSAPLAVYANPHSVFMAAYRCLNICCS